MYLDREFEGAAMSGYALYDYEAGVFTWHRMVGTIPDLFAFSLGLLCIVQNLGARLGWSGVRLR
jgi:hypothetical protein